MEVVRMIHADLAQAVAAAQREDMLRSAAHRSAVVVRRGRRRRTARLASWLKAQLHHPTPPAGVPNAPRCAWDA